ncbi:MAG: sugar phosphate isomerase/epimerase [candidate division Zixibacteria bacterium]|nr:sugar phosphate isomerase/epimerase [candidate division Zixibacteria bacterium]
MPAGVCAYSFNTGYDAFQLMDMAVKYGLKGAEFPPDDCLSDLKPDTLQKAREYAQERGLFLVADGGKVEPEMLGRLIPTARALGTDTLRVILSGILGGDRRPMAGKWDEHLKYCLGVLREAARIAEAHGVTIAVENHSDATSRDLLRLLEQIGSDNVGINLDVGNVLAVCEDPFGYADRLMPYLKNIHLKDYTLHPSDEGYRMARCALGKGVVDFPGLLSRIDTHHPDITKTIELGALYARHVRLLADDYWSEYPVRPVTEMLPLLRLFWKNARPRGEDWRTPKEKEESIETLLAYETREFEESVAYLKKIGAA